jgi:hypothetical protein
MLQAQDRPDAWTLLAIAVAYAKDAIDHAMAEAIEADAAFMWWWPTDRVLGAAA